MKELTNEFFSKVSLVSNKKININEKFRLFIFMSILMIFAQKVDAKGVAVIVNSGDVGGLQTQMDKTAKIGRDTYEKVGYDVIVLSASDLKNSPNGENLRKVLGDLKGYNDLKIDFIGHGGLTEIPKELTNRFLPLQLTEEQKIAGYNGYDKDLWHKKNIGWYAVNSQDGELLLKSRDPMEQSDVMDELIRNSIGVGDIRDGLEQFQKNNNSAHTTIHALNCFSGAIGQQLSDLKNTQVFSGTSAEQVNIAISQDLAQNWHSSGETAESRKEFLRMAADNNNLLMYYKELSENTTSGISRSNWEIENAVLKRYQDEIPKEAIFYYGVRPPRSSVFTAIMNWCSQNKGKVDQPSQILTKEQRAIITQMKLEINPFLENSKKCEDKCILDQNLEKTLVFEFQTRIESLVSEFIERFKAADPNGQMDVMLKKIIGRQLELMRASGNGFSPEKINTTLHQEMTLYQKDPKKYLQDFTSKILKVKTEAINACSSRKSISDKCVEMASAIVNLNALFLPEASLSYSGKMNSSFSQQEVFELIKSSQNQKPTDSLRSLIDLSSTIGQMCEYCNNKKAIFDAPKICLEKYEKEADSETWSRLLQIYSYGQRAAIESKKSSDPLIKPDDNKSGVR